jgi:two-component system LytT family response regulator
MPPASWPHAPLRVLVVDDEPLARSNLTTLLRRDPAIGAVHECSSGREAITVMRHACPDLLFLDVQMPECDGFDVLEALGSAAPLTTIFVTAHNEFALRAFEAGALDYLLKPFDDARFERALARAKERLVHAVPTRRVERLIVKTPGQVLFVAVADIDWIEAADYYACLHLGSATHLLRRPLAELEHELGTERFVRIHRSAIVNIARIRGLELREDGEYGIALLSGQQLRVSRGYRRRVQERLGIAGAATGEREDCS